jgi:DNA-binding response OmpR family regulator
MQKILIVDDDPQMQKLYDRIFEMEEFQVDTADDGRSGMDKVRLFRPDVILLDIMMKNVSGLEMLSQIKADSASREIPVVVLSNVSDPKIVNEARVKGASQYVVKSEKEPADMVAIVKDVLANSGAAGAGYM